MQIPQDKLFLLNIISSIESVHPVYVLINTASLKRKKYKKEQIRARAPAREREREREREGKKRG